MGSHEMLRVVLLWSLISSFKTSDAFWCHKHACVCYEWIAGTTLALWIFLACADVSTFVWLFHDSSDFIWFHDAGSFFDLPCLSFVYIAHHRYHHQHPQHHPLNHRLGSLATCFCPRSCRLGISASTTLPSRCSGGTVDGRNPAPPATQETLQTMGHYQLVQDFFHQQYVGKQIPLQIYISINKTFLV